MDTTIVIATAAEANKVQHVTKKSSDELLRKFAEAGSDEAAGENKRRKKKKRESELCECDSPSSNGGAAMVERRSLLLPKVTRRSVLLRQLRVRDVRNKSSLFGTIHKTWRRTVEGASRVFLEKHYHRHKRLINDIV
ncbi:hypothetical protein AAZX31_03G126800 [Glycine max]|uniref:Uncharacterized protein n=2 Tax=Glycine subgen. Soja TaxID=1462606 RepID=I1JNK7_SOYBN|nr:uncharacterized protein LOC100780602 [Glycine max]XP_028225390.1 uncharacterized protein LOC114406780 [Glycine soja]KAG5043412.1 hypothetical protein JHK87_007327 [Glycine soja]KAG5055199.1 hypothetical protein JHK85_007709 [Glycine max]KAG5072278.1 hypothetical protein JHK86_007489 [Glycine max]KAH1070017.1 hypothetical protein GYH30_007230 [Glycine max]KAH1258188.1 hypothetical protein GmHk_03G007979 [Glycine max]|eukprot:XP_003521215.1 uncharacterized protein LOC100780602 [Glycine max]